MDNAKWPQLTLNDEEAIRILIKADAAKKQGFATFSGEFREGHLVKLGVVLNEDIRELEKMYLGEKLKEKGKTLH
jgi:hypothetical protein